MSQEWTQIWDNIKVTHEEEKTHVKHGIWTMVRNIGEKTVLIRWDETNGHVELRAGEPLLIDLTPLKDIQKARIEHLHYKTKNEGEESLLEISTWRLPPKKGIA